MVNKWENLPQEVVESDTLSTFEGLFRWTIEWLDWNHVVSFHWLLSTQQKHFPVPQYM